jgi:hypothetical protein
LKNLNRHREVQMKSVRRSSRSGSGRIGVGRLAAALVLLTSFGMVAAAPSAQALSFERFFAANCLGTPAEIEECGKEAKPPLTVPEAEEHGFRQAGGYVPGGVTHFIVETEEIAGHKVPKNFLTGGSVSFLRTDVAPGVVTNPYAPGLPQCSMKEFKGTELEIAGQKVFTEPTCAPSTLIGINRVVTAVPTGGSPPFVDVPLTGKVYNLVPPPGYSSDYGVALNLHPIFGATVFGHTFIEGNVEWASDYHDYFEIKNIAPGLIESRLIFYGAQEIEEIEESSSEITNVFLTGERKFIRNPSACNAPGPATTTSIMGVSQVGEVTHSSYTSPIGPNNCALQSPFNTGMGFALTPGATGSDAPNGITLEATATHPETATVPDISDLKTASVTMPPGMTMNPSAASGLEGCTPAQIGIGTRNPVTCPSRSRLGTVNLEVPTLPAGSLIGSIFLGKPESGSITAPPYTVYLDAESARFGVKVRLKGTVTPNLETGQLMTSFTENPEAPFNSIALHLNGGAFAPIANPLTCGPVAAAVVFQPFSGQPGASLESPFNIENCASPQFAAPPISQSTSTEPPIGGAESNFTFTLTRPEGQQYLSQMSTMLPPGVVAKIPSVPRCAEAQANAGTCSAASQVGTVQIKAGSGEPFPFNGKVYLTEKYEGAPYGLSIVVPTAAGPFNFGNVVSRAKITVNQNTAQVGVALTKSFVPGHAGAVSGLPTIVQGIPTRIREITVNINRPNYLLNPTSCSPLKSESSLISTLGAKATPSSTLQVENCGALAFKPAFSASTNGKPTRANGASLGVNITQPVGGQANIQSVVTVLPKQLPSRLTTLQKACLLATFEADPSKCPKESNVGTATATTPTLPDKMSGPAYIVSRGAAFPDLEIVLEGDGVRIILDGKTNIKNSITTSSFLSNPDVPISSFGLNLPMGPFSLLAANGNFCLRPLKMPTTITGFNGKVLKQETQLNVTNCLPITRHKVHGHEVTVSVKIPQGGRVRFSGFDLSIHTIFPKKAKTVTVKMFLTPSGLFQLRNKHRLNSTIRVGFIPRLRGGASFTSFANVTFR